ncbi:MAG: DEAD/DEAH box helicase [Desulfobulbaceae bacterium]|jgi:superfamily II DNA or RNA helicase
MNTSSPDSTKLKALHPKATAFVRQNLFVGLTAFAELEKRIATLPDERSRGDAFEVFAEAYLATQRKHDAAQVWPLNATPTTVLQQLGLGYKDYGVDGVFRTLLGHFNAYQVKFRTNRATLTWRELSTFMGLADSPQIRSRVLFTNSDELPSAMNQRQGFFCIRGSDLDRLEADDFRAIEAWLGNAAFIPPKKQPLPHQQEALDALLPALQTHDRVSAIMACGTGKTLVALWVVERMQAKRALVLVPSLALLRQVLHEWLRETSLDRLAYLCVCSDRTVKEGLDSIATAQSDLDFQVTTDASIVRGFLDAPFAGTKIIFSTYQSAHMVGKALHPEEAFDLAVFDEAHKTAGREGRNYAFALEDDNIPIRKRLFLTATPRHYNPHQKDVEGEALLVFSMDSPEMYGPQAFRLNFAEAAQRGIICGYKVIISVITSEMITNDLLSRGEVVVEGDAVRARQVANQIALRDAIEKYGTSKVFTFHKTVKSAASFVADDSEGIRTHLPDFEAFHVSGAMPTARREREMRDFRSTPRAVMSNARCLTEGVDVPAVDMVAFLSPRRSQVDIVQATGRAMRRSPGKTTGYVLVPLYVELAAGETVEDAVSRSEFDEVWDVLQSLQEQDDVLAELIRHFGEQKGNGKGFDDSRFSDRVDFGGPRLGLEALRSAVTTRCLDRLCSSWDTWFGKLKSFKERFGHCNVATGFREDAGLWSWVSAQRTRRNKGLLSPLRTQRLEQLGFVWDFQAQKGQETWMKWYRELESYTREHGNSHVPRTHANTKLASWVWIQRARRDKNYGGQPPLTAEQVEHLDKLGFRWNVHDEKWAERLEELTQFKEQHGHCNVELVVDEKDGLLAWVKGQRTLLASGGLSTERKELLDNIGFPWTSQVTDHKWQEMYARLENYHAQYGDAEVPNRWKNDATLSAWVNRQRQRKKKGLIPDEQIQLLDALDFTWQHRERGSWEDRYQELIDFKAKHGHCNVPFAYDEKPKLGAFVNAMRNLYTAGSLSKQRVELLERCGFQWSARTDKWENRYDQLLAFRAAHGHCNVPYNSDNPQLSNWVSQQRHRKKAGKLTAEREKLLDEIGFTWTVLDFDGVKPTDLWNVRYKQLLEFKQKHGHCKVPYNFPDNPQLGGWVGKQREQRKLNKLTPERERLLDEIGFLWSVRSAA